MSAIPTGPPLRPSLRPPNDHNGPAGSRPAGPAGTRPSPARGDNNTAPPLPDAGFPPGSGAATAVRLLGMARGFAELFLEVEAGRRPRRQLAPLLTPMLYARLTDVWVRGGIPGHVVTVTLLSREAAHCDLLVLVRRGTRHGALSLRLIRVPGRGWLVDVVARPEDRQLPPPAYPVATPDTDDDELAIPSVAAPSSDWMLPC